MDRDKDEKALRRLIAGLAQARPEDVEAVLDELSVDQRRVVRELLDAYHGKALSAPPTAKPKTAADDIDLSGFSAALIERLQGRGGEATAAWRMTPAAAEALRSAARGIPPEPTEPPLHMAAGQRRRWFLGGPR